MGAPAMRELDTGEIPSAKALWGRKIGFITIARSKAKIVRLLFASRPNTYASNSNSFP